MKQTRSLRSVLGSLPDLLGGNLALVFGLNLFLEDNGIAAGGFSGIGIIVNYVVPVPIGLFVFLLTLPFLLWSYFVRGLLFTALTAVSTLFFSILADALDFLPTLTEDLMLASVCGGLFYGLAAFLFLRGNSSSGGTDLVARLLLHRWRSLSLGSAIILTDGLVVLASVLVSGSVELGIYAVVSLSVCSITTDMLIRTANKANLFLIVTARDPGPIAETILFALGRGATCLNAVGMYSRHLGHEDRRHVLMVVVKPREVWRMEALVRKADPAAFTVHCPANSISGKGFPFLSADGAES